MVAYTGYGMRGLGDTSGSPCNWFDNVWLTQPCQDYLQANDPTNPLLVMVQNGAIVGGAQVVGNTVGTAAGDAVGSAVGSATGAAASSVEQTGLSYFQNSNGSLNLVTIGLAGLGIFVLLKVLTK